MTSSYSTHLEPRRIFGRRRNRKRRRAAGLATIAFVAAVPFAFAAQTTYETVASWGLEGECVECRPAAIAAGAVSMLIEAPRRKPTITASLQGRR